MNKILWMRLGDGGDYERFDGIGEAADSLRENRVRGPYRKCMGGIKAPGFQGNNYISLYWGDEDANLTQQLNDTEFSELCQFVGEIGDDE